MTTPLPPGGPDPGNAGDGIALVRIHWTETRHYQTDLTAADLDRITALRTAGQSDPGNLDPTPGQLRLQQTLAALPPAARTGVPSQELPRVIEATDLTGDGLPEPISQALATGEFPLLSPPRAPAEGPVFERDWGELADRVDERLAESWSWPALAATLDTLAGDGYDVDTHLPRLVTTASLPDLDPARELQYRLLADASTTAQRAQAVRDLAALTLPTVAPATSEPPRPASTPESTAPTTTSVGDPSSPATPPAAPRP